MKPLKLLCLVLPLMFIAAGFKSQPEKVNEFSKSLLQAAAEGNIEQVKSLLSKGADVNAGKWAPLHAAVYAEKRDTVELLIANGADVNAKDESDSTPLCYAIWNDDKDMVRLLVAKGADVSFTREKGYPPLHYAVWNEDSQMVELFVANGAKFDVKDQDGWTAFRYAASQGSRDMVEFFVSKGADVSTSHLAACVGDLARVQDFVQQGTDVDEKDELNWTPLYWAASTGQTDVAEFLIAEGADVHVKAKDSSTALHQAARAGGMKLVKLLISKGADVNAKDERGNTPLHGAASAGHREVVELLIAKGANVDARGRYDRTPLHNAAMRGHGEVVEILIAKGADVNAKDKDGRTLLHRAAEEGRNELAGLLVANGADIDVEDAYGRTPLHCAAVKGHKNVVESLLAKGTNIDVKDNAGRTPLHYAAGAGWIYGVIGGDIGIAKSLLNKGANINATDRVGWTALHYATQVRNKAMVELLVERGADLNAPTERGHTAFTLARGMPTRYRGHSAESERVKLCSEIAQVLRKHMAVYYVASDGRDSNPGTLESPFRTLPAAIDVAMPGDIIVVRGGLYACSSSISIDTSGEAGRPICLRAYPDETPVFDFSDAKGDGFLITGAYWHIKGLTVTGAEYWGIVVETKGGHHNILEQLTAYANGGMGVFVLNGAANNLILNCDSYRNFDTQTNGENADGFAAARALGKGNVLIGCRAWNNADDGFDSGMGDAGVRLENCYVWRNGENIWDHPCFTGNANGFKLGSGNHVLIRCMAWDHPVRGFKLQLEATGVTLYNCTAFRNRTNYQFIWPTSNIEKNVLRNCLSFKGRIRVKPEVDDKHNSWNEAVSMEITEDDFLSLDDSVSTGPRNPDGSIPESDFLRLAPESDAIDAGTDVGLPFVGKAPDLGAFEYRPAATGKRGPKMLHQAVRDRDIKQIRELLSKDADVNEKDWLGYTAIHWAIYFGYTDVTEVLISEGANPNIQSDTGRTPLEIAIEMGYEGLVELLRKHGSKE